jgi:NAD(P)-dependent dehydrogenase (short-subunit alcohol dehydrogenase family)
VVTGAGRGIGREHALLLGRRGANVVVNNRSHDAAVSVVKEITQEGGNAIAHCESIATPAGARSLVDIAIERFGGIDIIVSNAGILEFLPFTEIDAQKRDDMFAVHMLAAWNIAQCAWPHMLAQKHGRIVLTLSSAALWGMPNGAHYCGAKAALIGLVKGLALEGGPHGIHVNGLAVGGATRMIEERIQDPSYLAWARRAIPPSAAAQPMGWLSHKDCRVNGEMFGACGRWMSRIVLVNTHGFAPAGEYSPESIRDNFDSVMSTDRYEIYSSVADHAAAISKRLRVPFEPSASLEQLGSSNPQS